MKSITTSADLKNAIRVLELEQKNNLLAIKEEVDLLQESLKPANIIKSTFKKMVDVPDLKAGIVNTVIGVVSGIMTKKLVLGKTHNPISKLLAVAMEMLVANKVTKNADFIRITGSMLLNKFFKKKNPVEKVYRNDM